MIGCLCHQFREMNHQLPVPILTTFKQQGLFKVVSVNVNGKWKTKPEYSHQEREITYAY